jgi:hypothetical protein
MPKLSRRATRREYILVMAVASLMLIPAGFMSLEELKFIRSGAVADATIDSVQEFERQGARHNTVYLEVDYRFTDEHGHPRRGRDQVPPNWTFPKDPQQTVPVEYLSTAPHNSRLKGHTNRFWVFILFGLPVFIAGHSVWHWKFARR